MIVKRSSLRHKARAKVHWYSSQDLRLLRRLLRLLQLVVMLTNRMPSIEASLPVRLRVLLRATSLKSFVNEKDPQE
jgi:hypothetical protein